MSGREPVTAEIIPFPLRKAPEADGNARLRRALVGLDEALASQRAALAEWRGALKELGGVVSGLGQGLRRYHSSLDTVSARVGQLHTQAVQLERTADAALALSADQPR